MTAGASAPRTVILVDGRSGSGKTTLAPRIAAEFGAQLVRLDDLYPGWDGLEAGAAAVVDDVLRADAPGWRAWDWVADAPAAWHPLDPAAPIVVEGCGALSRASAPLATLSLWVELDDEERKVRALARDGVAYAPHWDRWAAQEAAFLAREHPRALADVVVDGRAL